ncbi:hypothetical protein FA13DRAFT_671831 [Coprinellus micaceus]|uniref:Helicase ATP-binding domain-containing protein n=1 Tax=Coprinellus micaceus TaxID=71717 RepID=A0A4Y7T5P2_COPMI|nr:hypothetical protein FA13DRAFT_671831 [Coprinellus micaceus]
MAERYIKRLCGGRLKEEVEAGSQGFALCYAMGMGKTHVVVAVHYMLHIYMQEVAKVLGASVLPVKKNLIVAPVGMHQHWKDHITRITGGAITVEVYNRTGKHSSGLSDSSAHVIITNPETLVNDRKRFKENRATIEKLVSDAVAHGNPKTPDDLREMFTKQSDERCLPRDAPLGVTTWGVVIIDEFHDGCLANAENLASRAVLSLNADGFGLLSGTPAQNSVNGDLQAPLQLLSTHRSKRKDISLVEEECAKAGKKVGS